MERFEKWLQSLNPRDLFRLALLCGLVEGALVVWMLSLLPPPPVCDPGEAPFPPGFCVYEPQAADAPGRNIRGVDRKSDETNRRHGPAEKGAGHE
jgi:hypothetical protein